MLEIEWNRKQLTVFKVSKWAELDIREGGVLLIFPDGSKHHVTVLDARALGSGLLNAMQGVS